MAAQSGKKKKNTKPKSATATEIHDRRTAPAADTGRRQVVAIVLFATAIFLLFVALIKGQNVWAALHNFLFGVFGVCAWLCPFVLGFIAVLCAKGDRTAHFGRKTTESVLVVLLLGAAIDIFGRESGSTLGFIDSIVTAYQSGAEMKGGGFFGCLLGYPLTKMCGKTGAAITIVLLTIVFFMLATGTTLISAWNFFAKPAQKTARAAGEAFSAHREETARRREELADLTRRKFDVDVPLDDEEARQKAIAAAAERAGKEPDLREMERNVIDAYHDRKPEEKPRKKKQKAEPNPIDAAIDGISDELFKVPEPEQNPAEAAEAAGNAGNTGAAEPFSVPESSGISIEGEDDYRFPPVSLLQRGGAERTADISDELKATATKLVDTLRSFGVETRIVDISRGPSVTRYELQPAAGVKINKITNLSDDIALNLATAGVRIEAPIPNKAAVGIEVPNKISSIVHVREILESPAFLDAKSKLTIALGRDIAGNAVVADIAKMPHGLIAGATGSGKSVCINSIIMSLLFKANPDEVKLLMIDPKVVELGIYNGIPHLLVPVVTEPRRAAGALGWAVTEMENRYKLFAENNVRDLKGYNRLAESHEDMIPMPHIVIIIDELADLMMTAPGEVEDAICRIAQKARAAGMHLIIATQRPSVNVITGVIKANIPTRIAFAVSSSVDSRTILDMSGAERLMGRGDMLFYPVGAVKPRRVQGCFVDDDEVEAVVEFIKNGKVNEYDEAVLEEIERQAVSEKSSKDEDADEEFDPMINQAIEVVVDAGQASTSLLQRRLKLGYARAARIVDQMEQKGVVGPYEGSKPRQVLISKAEFLEMQAGGQND